MSPLDTGTGLRPIQQLDNQNCLQRELTPIKRVTAIGIALLITTGGALSLGVSFLISDILPDERFRLGVYSAVVACSGLFASVSLIRDHLSNL